MKLMNNIRFRIAILILILGTVLVSIYSLFLYYKLEQNKDRRIRRELESKARQYVDYYAEERNIPLQPVSFSKPYIGMDSMPDTYKELMKDLSEGTHRIIRDAEYYVVVKRLPKNDETFYLIRRFEIKSTFEIATRHAIPALVGALLIVLVLAVVTIVSLSSLIISPLCHLVNKLKSLDPEHLPEDFSKDYHDDEVGFVASTIENLFIQLRKYVDREHQFTRDASHELRTPVTVIKSSAEVIEEITKEDGRKLTPQLMRIKRSVDQMEGTIEALLWLYRGDKSDLHTERCFLVPMVERVIQDNKITYRERRLKVDFIERDHPVIIAQPSLLRVIIANLIRNAFQHTHEGAITIEVNRDWLEVVNSSEGGGNQIHGMVPHANDDQTNGGFGIGLDLVRRLCERFGWRFTIETRNGAETVARINF